VINFERLRAMDELLTAFLIPQQRAPYRFNSIPFIQSWLGLSASSGSLFLCFLNQVPVGGVCNPLFQGRLRAVRRLPQRH